jgi:hypothetical protein
MIPGKHCDLSTYLAKRARSQSGACAEMQFPDYITVFGTLAVKMFQGKHCDFSTYLAKRASAQCGACAEVQFPDYGRVLWSPGSRKLFQESTAISAPMLQRERELSLAHAQRCKFLIMEQCCGPLVVEIVLGKPESTAISAPILPIERELSLVQAQRCSFLIMEQCCGPVAVETFPGKHRDFSTYLAKRARAQSGSCAEVQFPDYGTVLWAHGSRNDSRKETAISTSILPRELELSLSMRRGAVS